MPGTGRAPSEAGTQLPIIRTSERTTFKRCPQRWWWSYREGRKPKGPPSKNLWFGTGIHLALSEWYGKGTERLIHPLETWEKWARDEMVSIRVYAERFEADEKVYLEALELGRIMLEEYLKEYGEDEQWDFIACERSGNVLIPGESGTPIARYAYTFDGVYRDLADGTIKLLENKTAAAISTSHLSLDDQAGSYWAVASTELQKDGVLGEKERITGITYNFLRKTTPDDRPRHPKTGERTNKPIKQHYIDALTLAGVFVAKSAKVEELQKMADDIDLTVYGDVSKVQPLPNFERHFVERTRRERNTQIRRIRDEARVMEEFRTGALPLIKTPRSTGVDACQHGCEFFLMCEQQESGGDGWETLRKQLFRVEDPYQDHRKSAHMAS